MEDKRAQLGTAQADQDDAGPDEDHRLDPPAEDGVHLAHVARLKKQQVAGGRRAARPHRLRQ